MADYSNTSTEDLELKLQDLGRQRAEAEAGYVAQMTEIADELESRASRERLGRLLATLTPADIELLKTMEPPTLATETVEG